MTIIDLVLVIVVQFVRYVYSRENNVYYIATVEIDWDYAPNGDVLHAAGSYYTHNRTRFRKAVYREYTDATFSQQMEPKEEHGILGPVLKIDTSRGQDYVIVHFKNLASRPYSIHVHGGLYHEHYEYAYKHDYISKASEGAKYSYNWMSFPAGNVHDVDDEVPPGWSHTYTWGGWYQSGPGMDDDECVPWVFHSHASNVQRDIHSGPVGVVLVCNPNRSAMQGRRTSERFHERLVTHDFVVILQTFDERKSWYAEENGVTDSDDVTFHTINGLTYGNLRLDVCSADLVRWWILSLGDTQDVHSFHVHGHTLNQQNLRTSAAMVLAGMGSSARMVVQEPGQWLIRDLIEDHYAGGLQAILNVKKCNNNLKEVMESYQPVSMQSGNSKTYYIAAEETHWNYAPSGKDQIWENKGWSQMYMKNESERPGSIYKKAMFVEYTDETFSVKKERPVAEQYLGLLGPLIEAGVEDNITVVFKNRASRSHSIYPIGVKYTKPNEGFGYNDADELNGDLVPPGRQHIYHWSVPSLWTNQPADKFTSDCMAGMYQSAVHPIKDVHSGLVGPILICNKRRNQEKEIQIHILTTGDVKNTPVIQVSGQIMSDYRLQDIGPASFPGVFRSYHIKTTSAGTWLLENTAVGEAQKGMAAYVEVTPSCTYTPTDPAEDIFTRTYYIAAVEVEWDYAPMQYDFIRDEPLWVKPSTGYLYASLEGSRMGTRYKKVVYREYTDETFQYQKPITEVHLGILGPVITAATGDTVQVVFHNMASRPYSIHAVGLEYNKSSEGYGYGPEPAPGSAVLPNQTYTYTWRIPDEKHGVKSCVSRLYYSAVDQVKDIHSGLVGPIVICKRSEFDENGTRAEWPYSTSPVNYRNFYLLFHVFDENLSWYFEDNLQKYGSINNDPNQEDNEFKESNRMHSINGKIYGNLEGVISSQHTNIDFILLSVETAGLPHPVHFHSVPTEMYYCGINTRTDTVPLFPGTAVLVEQHNDINPGTWMIRSAMTDQYEAGMALLWHFKDPNPDENSEGPWWYWKIGRTEKNLVLVGGSIVVLIIVLIFWYSYKHIRRRHFGESHPIPI